MINPILKYDGKIVRNCDAAGKPLVCGNVFFFYVDHAVPDGGDGSMNSPWNNVNRSFNDTVKDLCADGCRVYVKIRGPINYSVYQPDTYNYNMMLTFINWDEYVPVTDPPALTYSSFMFYLHGVNIEGFRVTLAHTLPNNVTTLIYMYRHGSVRNCSFNISMSNGEHAPALLTIRSDLQSPGLPVLENLSYDIRLDNCRSGWLFNCITLGYMNNVSIRIRQYSSDNRQVGVDASAASSTSAGSWIRNLALDIASESSVVNPSSVRLPVFEFRADSVDKVTFTGSCNSGVSDGGALIIRSTNCSDVTINTVAYGHSFGVLFSSTGVSGTFTTVRNLNASIAGTNGGALGITVYGSLYDSTVNVSSTVDYDNSQSSPYGRGMVVVSALIYAVNCKFTGNLDCYYYAELAAVAGYGGGRTSAFENCTFSLSSAVHPMPSENFDPPTRYRAQCAAFQNYAVVYLFLNCTMPNQFCENMDPVYDRCQGIQCAAGV